MDPHHRTAGRLLLTATLLLATPAVAEEFPNFEGAQVHPIAVSADGTRLYAVQTADARLSVFALEDPSRPRLVAEIPVGMEPVSVAARSSDEVWVANQLSDSVSVVSLSRRAVVETIQVGDEPADVLFAGDLACVSVAGSHEVRLYDAATRTLNEVVPLQGRFPRALAVGHEGRTLFVALALAGNGTTILPAADAPAPPSAPDLPPSPRVGMVVPGDDPRIPYRVLDHDVAVIDLEHPSHPAYISGVCTVNLGLAVRPGTDDLFVVGTEARNHRRLLSTLGGRFTDNLLVRISDGEVSRFDLNAELDDSQPANAETRQVAIAQPTDIVFSGDGRDGWIASFGSDRLVRVRPDGTVLNRVRLTPETEPWSPRRMRGPRGLALHPSGSHLYVLNRVSGTISVLDLSDRSVGTEIPIGTHDPTPAGIRQGRGFFYDSRLSGNGTGSCASCHVDGDTDHLAWDLGNPHGKVGSHEDPTTGRHTFHPLAGPMVTQTMRGLAGHAPYHWRGDIPSFVALNGGIVTLMGGQRLPDEDMELFRQWAMSIRFPPNPNRSLDGSLPPSLGGGDPAAGLRLHQKDCGMCHPAEPGTGTDNRVVSGVILHTTQSLKNPHLRNVYQKLALDRRPGATSVAGFGMWHDGSVPDVVSMLERRPFSGRDLQRLSASDLFSLSMGTVHSRKGHLPLTTRIPFDVHSLPRGRQAMLDISAFLQCFDTGTHPATGRTVTLAPDTVRESQRASRVMLLQRLAEAGAVDLIAKGTLDGTLVGLLFEPESGNWRPDSALRAAISFEELRAAVHAGDVLSIMAVPRSSGARMGIDRNLDGVLDADEAASRTLALRPHETP